MSDSNLAQLLATYAAQIADTDILDPSEVNPVLQGLYGEVGGIMSTAKKHIRERAGYPGFQRAAEEEFGDTLWYLAALCRRLRIPLQEAFPVTGRRAYDLSGREIGVEANDLSSATP